MAFGTVITWYKQLSKCIKENARDLRILLCVNYTLNKNSPQTNEYSDDKMKNR